MKKDKKAERKKAKIEKLMTKIAHLKRYHSLTWQKIN
jgi:hypothetical protein